MDKKFITIIVASAVTVVLWIGLEVWVRLSSEDVQLNYQNYLESVSTEFDSETIEDLVTREEEYMLIDRDSLD
jgi:hypothetical protein